MSIVIITGSGGLIGAEAVKFLSKKFSKVIGIDNDMRSYFFGKSASVKKNIKILKSNYKNYSHYNMDIRNFRKLRKIFKKYNKKILFIVHCAAQPSHDWAAREPHTDFSVNALGTLNILESMRKYSPNAVFIFTFNQAIRGFTTNQYAFIYNRL